jgi:hypothetical protein
MAMLEADDFTLPEPEPVVEFEVVVALVPEFELLPEVVSWPEISE